MRTIKVFDTTLRDGEQGIGFCMTSHQKIRILKTLDTLGLDVIELGFPAASPEDKEWVRLALAMKPKTKCCVFTRLNTADINILLEAIKGAQVQVQLLAVGSEIHLTKKRNITRSESLLELHTAIQQLHTSGQDDICVIFEDSTRGSMAFIEEAVTLCLNQKVTGITIADTTGCATPEKIYAITKHLREIVPYACDLGIHCHNDLGLATANTLSAIRAGANIIQTTLGGIGERTGNCALEEIFAALFFCQEEYKAKINIDPKRTYNACHFVFQEMGGHVAANKPIIGEHVFSTSAGLHQDGLIKDPEIYTHVQPEVFGREHQLIFNRLSGRKLIQATLSNYPVSARLLTEFTRTLTAKQRDFTVAEILAEFQAFQVHKREKNDS